MFQLLNRLSLIFDLDMIWYAPVSHILGGQEHYTLLRQPFTYTLPRLETTFSPTIITYSAETWTNFK